MKKETTIFLFRRDLRCEVNAGFFAAASEAECLLPLFVLDEKQIGKKNAYKSDAALQFMHESLVDLKDSLEAKGSSLLVEIGIVEEVLKRLQKKCRIRSLHLTADYTPFSKKRDAAIAAFCKKQDIALHVHHDVLLHTPGDVLKGDKTPYTVYSFFAKAAKLLPMELPKTARKLPPLPYSWKQDAMKKLAAAYKKNDKVEQGGRRMGKLALAAILKKDSYAKLRDVPSEHATSQLSAHLKFGTISAKEVYLAVEKKAPKQAKICDELLWRDFFTHIAWYFPDVFGAPFYKKYGTLRWDAPGKKFTAFCAGMTGFPIVDAGVRELLATGRMHNRVRMIVASFLIKDLHIDWQIGEKFFAQHLVDYDPAVNNGNWQWVASTGCDALPFFRIFNPWTQQKKFDKDCTYIKTWIPELAPYSAKEIHKHETSPLARYPAPIINHKTEAKEARYRYDLCQTKNPS